MLSLSKKTVATALAAAIGAGAVVPAAQAAPSTTRTSVFHIRVDDGALAGGGNTVRAKVVVKNPQRTVRNWYSRATIAKVVREGVNNGYQKPYNAQGYRCTPVLDGSMNASVARFTCKLRGADVPTTVKVTYTAAFPTNAG
jgi:hypothetical protein